MRPFAYVKPADTAAALAADGARPLRRNAFKTELLKRAVERQLRVVAGGCGRSRRDRPGQALGIG